MSVRSAGSWHSSRCPVQNSRLAASSLCFWRPAGCEAGKFIEAEGSREAALGSWVAWMKDRKTWLQNGEAKFCSWREGRIRRREKNLARGLNMVGGGRSLRATLSQSCMVPSSWLLGLGGTADRLSPTPLGRRCQHREPRQSCAKPTCCRRTPMPPGTGLCLPHGCLSLLSRGVSGCCLWPGSQRVCHQAAALHRWSRQAAPPLAHWGCPCLPSQLLPTHCTWPATRAAAAYAVKDPRAVFTTNSGFASPLRR